MTPELVSFPDLLKVKHPSAYKTATKSVFTLYIEVFKGVFPPFPHCVRFTERLVAHIVKFELSKLLPQNEEAVKYMSRRKALLSISKLS